MAVEGFTAASSGVRRYRLEDRIRELCADVATAKEPELNAILAELRDALREHSSRLRRMTAEQLTRAKPKPA
jgi:uncharacterized coiled-coil protein SlyX